MPDPTLDPDSESDPDLESDPYPDLGIGIESNVAGISIPAFGISVRYRSILVPDWIHLFRYRTRSPYSGTALVQNPLKSGTSSDFLILFYPDSSPLNYFFIFAEFFRHLACYDLSLFSVTFCIFFVLCSNNSLAAVAVQHKKSNRCTVFYLGCSNVPVPTHFL